MSKAFLCPFPGCFKVVPTSGRYCVSHAYLQAEKDQREQARASARWERHHQSIGYSWVWHDSRWRKLRADHLKKEPNCRSCGAKATTVDHIVPHRGDERRAFDPDNLQSLCDRCSAAKSREDRRNPIGGSGK